MAKVTILGMPELQANLKTLGSALTAVLDKAALAGGEVFRVAAIAKAPHRTGNLKRNIVCQKTSEDPAGGGFLLSLAGPRDTATVAVGPNAEAWYGRLVEYVHAIVPRGQAARAHRLKTERAKRAAGFEFVPAHPFMRPAFDESRPAAEAAAVAVLRQATERAAAALPVKAE